MVWDGTLRLSTDMKLRRHNHKIIQWSMAEYLVRFNQWTSFQKVAIFYLSTFCMKHFTELFHQSPMVESNHMTRLSDKILLCLNMVIAFSTGYIFHFDTFSELSLALHKEGLWLTKTDTQPERTLRWATHRSQSWYTPLVEVNQAILAWSF